MCACNQVLVKTNLCVIIAKAATSKYLKQQKRILTLEKNSF